MRQREIIQIAAGLMSFFLSGTAIAENSGIQIKIYIGTKDFKEYNAETIAELFDMSQSGLPGGPRRDYRQKIQEVHKLRLDYNALVYRNVKEIASYAKDDWQTALANNWLLKDINGRLVPAKHWPEDYAADIGNPEYRKWIADKIKQWLDKNSFFDGVFADNGLNAYVGEWLWDYADKPINPRTGAYWKDEEIKQAYISLHKEIKKAIGSKLLICNGIFHGERFYSRFDDYQEVISNSPLDGIMSEGTWQAWFSEQAWLDSLKFLSWIEDNFLTKNSGRYFIPVVNDVFSSGIAQEQLTIYGVASTLLAVKTNQVYMGGLLGRSVEVNQEFNSGALALIRRLRKVKIGCPLNAYYVVAGTRIYARDFTNGKVLVNPTAESYNISLDKDYYTLDGRRVSELTMDSHRGEILLTKSH